MNAARKEREDAFRRLVEPYRKELYAHCYRMLGSVHDADDALQEALLRAWRGLARFEGRGSIRSWLYRITTNACIDLMARRPARVLPIDHGPAAAAGDDLDDPVTEAVWVEPYADRAQGLQDGYESPEARYERRESVELAFIVALQHLPPNQRATLILRDVLGFSARETAEVLETTVASVNGALRRARKAAAERLPDRSQQEALRALGDDGIAMLVRRYVNAWERGDVAAILALLADDATFTMPPLPTWYRGHEAIASFLTRYALRDRWRLVPVWANAQLAFGCYAWDAESESHAALSLDVLTLEGSRATDVTSFVTPYIAGPARARFAADVFNRFGLPKRLDEQHE